MVFRAMQASAGSKTSYEPSSAKPGGINPSSGKNYSVEELVRVLKEHPQFMTDTSGLYEYMAGSKNLYEMPAKSREGTDKDLQFDFTNSKNAILDKSIKKPMNDRHSLIYLPSLLDLLNENLEMNRIFKENFMDLKRLRDGESIEPREKQPSRKELEEELIMKEKNLRDQLQQELRKREMEAGRIKQEKDSKWGEIDKRRKEENERLNEMEKRMNELRKRNEELERLLREKNGGSKPPTKQITPKQRPPSSSLKKSVSRQGSQVLEEPKPDASFDYSKGIVTKENLVSGEVILNVVHGRDLLDNGENEAIDYYGVVVYPSGQRSRLKTIKNTKTPIWNQKIKRNLGVDKECEQKISIFLYSKESGIFSKEKSIGCIEISLNEMLEAPGKWQLNKLVQVKAVPESTVNSKRTLLGFICIQGGFFSGGKAAPDPPKPQEDIRELVKKPSFSGNLIVNVCHARNLASVDLGSAGPDSCDPLISLIYPNKQVFKTGVKKANLNPVWNQKFGTNLEIPEGSTDPLRIQLMNAEAKQERLIGVCDIDLQPCYSKKNQWVYNQYFDIKPVKRTVGAAELFGQVYLQVKFDGSDANDDGKVPKVSESIEQLLGAGYVSGSLQVFVHYFNNVPLTWRQCIDPFLKIKFPTLHSVTSEVFWNKRGAVVNYKYKANSFLNPSVPQELSVSLIDADHESTSEEVLGRVSIKVNEALNNPKQWKMGGVYKLERPQETIEKYSKSLEEASGDIGLSLRFVPETVPEPKEMPSLAFDEGEVLETVKEYEEESVQGRLRLSIEFARNLLPLTSASNPERKCNANCRVVLPNGKILNTKEAQGTNEPKWKKKFIEEISVKRKLADVIDLEVFDKHEKGSDFIGMVRLPMKRLLKNPCNSLFS